MNRFHAHSVFRVLVVLCFGALLAACDQSEQAGQTGQATADSEQDDGKPISAMAALDRQIDSGKMTSGEAIVAVLQVLIGERTEKEVFGPDAPPLREGTEIVHRAQAYLKTGPDEKHKVEIRRILNILMPSWKELEGRSVPEKSIKNKSSQSRPNSKAHAVLLTIPGFFSVANAAGGRDLVNRPFRVGGNIYVIYYPRAWAGNPGRLESVDNVEQALKDSYRAYNGLAPPGMRGKIVVHMRPDVRNNIYANAANEAGHCRINVYRTALAQQPGGMKQTVAHEVFHCFQGWNMPRQMHGDNTATWASYRRWWSEGSAEYFATVVYPCTNDEHQFIHSFDRSSTRTSLLQFEYENFMFFQFLANQPGLGNRGIVRFLMSGPTSGKWNEQAAHLAGVANMPELIKKFGQAYLDRKLLDSCDSKPFPVHPRAGKPLRIKAPGNYEASTRPFLLARRQVEFDNGWEFGIKTKREGPTMRDSSKEPPNETWEPFPEKVITSCAESRRQLLVTATTGNVDAESTFRIAVESGNRRQVRSAKVDKCLVGTWRLENESEDRAANSMLSQLLPPGLGASTTLSSSGATQLHFDRGCKSSVTYKDRTSIETTKITRRSRKKGPQTVQVVAKRIANGTDTADYAASGGIITFSNLQLGSCEEEWRTTTASGNTVTSRSTSCGKRSGRSSTRSLGLLQSPGGNVDMDKMMADAHRRASRGGQAGDSPEQKRFLASLRQATGEALNQPPEDAMTLLTGQAAYECSSRQLRLTITSGQTTFPPVTFKRVGQ